MGPGGRSSDQAAMKAMAVVILLLLALCGLPGAAGMSDRAKHMSLEAQRREYLKRAAEISNPINAVVRVIMAMKEKVVDERLAKQKEYGDFSCQCSTSQKNKLSDKLSSKLQSLSNALNLMIAQKVELDAEVRQLKAERNQAGNSSLMATRLRNDEHNDFLNHSQEEQNKQSVLSQAINVLQKVHKENAAPSAADVLFANTNNSLLQFSHNHDSAALLHMSSEQMGLLRQLSLTMDMQDWQREVVSSFLATRGSSLGPDDAGEGIQVVIAVFNNMLQGSQVALANLVSQEKSQKAAYDSFMEADRARTAGSTNILEGKMDQSAALGVRVYSKKADIDDVAAQRDNAKAQEDKFQQYCTTAKSSWEKYQLSASKELEVLQEVILFLTGDQVQAVGDAIASAKGTDSASWTVKSAFVMPAAGANLTLPLPPNMVLVPPVNNSQTNRQEKNIAQVISQQAFITVSEQATPWKPSQQFWGLPQLASETLGSSLQASLLAQKAASFLQQMATTRRSPGSAQAPSFLQRNSAQDPPAAFDGGHRQRLSFVELALADNPRGMAMVIAKINGMIRQFEQDQQDDQTQRQWCLDQVKQIHDQTFQNQKSAIQLNSTLQGMQARYELKVNDIADMIAQTKLIDIDVAKMTLDRQTQNAEFNKGYADNREAARLITVATQKLTVFYNKQVSLAQEYSPKIFTQIKAESGLQILRGSRHRLGLREDPIFQGDDDADTTTAVPIEDAASMPNLDPQTQDVATVTNMLNDIENNLLMKSASMKATEDAAQQQYESSLKAKSDQKTTLTHSINDKQTDAANVAGQIMASKDQLKQLEDSINGAADQLAALAPCNDRVNNYQLRMQARLDQKQDLRNVKATLNGAKLSDDDWS